MINQPDNPYQDALLKQLNGGRQNPATARVSPVGGFQAPVDPKTTPIEVGGAPQAPVSGPKDYRQIFMDTMKDYGYGTQNLANAKDALGAQGIRLQLNSEMPSRGRVYLPSGQGFDVFDKAEGTTATDNWATDPRGSAYDWREAPTPAAPDFSMDAGGGMSMPTPFPTSVPGDPSLESPIVYQDQQSPYLAALLAQLGLGS